MVPILYLSHSGSMIGGAEKQLAYLLTHIDQRRYQPLVVCPDDGAFAEYLRCRDIRVAIRHLPPWRRATSLIVRYSSAQKLVALAKRHAVRIAHTSDFCNPYLCYLKSSLKIPIVSHVRNLLTPIQVRKYKFDQIDHSIAISEQSKVPLIQGGIDNQKISVILNCVDVSVFRPASVVPVCKEYVVGIVGRIEPFKRQKEFVEIAAKVAAQCQRIRFHVIGDAASLKHRRYKEEVYRLVAKRRLEDLFHFAGHRTDMPRAMQGLDLLVTLSAGSVIAEAMAAGKPVIATPLGSSPEMIRHGETGYLLPLNRAQTIADVIVQLATDPGRNLRMGQRARKYAEKTFSVHKHVQKVEAIYEKLLTTS